MKKDNKKEKVKESIEKAITRNIPLDNIKWISQPLSITMMRADLSSMQVNLVVEMVDKFQDKIMEQIKKDEEERRKTPTLFSEDELQQERYVVRFSLSDLNVRPDAYDELAKAAKALQSMQIVMPVAKPDGSVNTDIFSLFSRISIPMLPGEYGYKGGKRRAGYIEMTMDKDAFNDVMRVGRQYTKYIKSVTRNRKCSYTSRLYMFISTYKTFGRWTISYMEFHKTLGFSYDDEKGKTVFLKYKLFSDVKRRVLDPSMDELKKMSEEGASDCYFEYEPIFPHGKARGLPEKLCFTIYSSDIGKELTVESRKTAEHIQIEKYLKKELLQTPTNCQKLMNLVTDENRTGFQNKMKYLKDFCSDPKNKVDNIRSYAWHSLKDYLDSHQPEVVEIIPEEPKNISQQEKAEKVAQKPDVTLNDEDQKKWEHFLSLAKEKVSNNEFKTWFMNMTPVSFEGNTLVVQVPSQFFYEYLEAKYVEVIRDAIYTSFGEGAKLMYNVKA